MAALLQTGRILIGCEDEFPTASVSVNAYNGGLTDMAISGGGQVIALATYDELNYTAIGPGGLTQLEAEYGIDPAWWTALDDPEDAQAYLLAYNDTEEKILIVGGGDQGLKHGVMDFVKSLDQVTFSTGRSWSPDPRGPSPNSTCNSYGATDCGAASPSDPTCWSGGSWDPATEAMWCPETALNRPDILVRMGHPSPKSDDGAGATFLGSLFKRSDATGASCSSSLDWIQTVLTKCNPSERDCEEQIMRFDSLVAGNYTHALDESRPLLTVTHAGSKPLECRSNPGITNADLYEELYDYLAARQVELLPTVYGLETRTGDEPVNGLEDGGVSELGENGEAAVAEGLSVILKPFEVCDTGLVDADGPVFYLAPVPEIGVDADEGHDPCDYLEPAGTVGSSTSSQSQGPGPHVSLHSKGSLLTDVGLRTYAPKDLTATNISTGWLKYDVLANPSSDADDALSPAAGSGTRFMTVSMPILGATNERLFVVDFDVYAPGRSSDNDGLEVIVEFHADAGLTYPRALESAKYSIAQTGNVNRYPGGNTDGSVHASVVFRAPSTGPDIKEAWIEFKSYADMSGGGVWVDNIRVTELDGALANMDASTLYIEDSSASYVPPACYDANGLSTSAVMSPFDMSGSPQWDKGSIRVDSSCVTAGETLFVSYTTRTPGGLTPLGEDRQGYNASPPDVFNPNYWDDPLALSPKGQLTAYQTLYGGVEPDFVMLSDLGGELRGIGRAPDAYGVSSSDILSTYTCMVDYLVCDTSVVACDAPATTSGGGGMLESCWQSQVDPASAAFQACDCSSSTRHLSALTEAQTPNLLVSGDMYTEWHNGGRELYQLPYGGFQDPLFDGREKLASGHVTFLSWWHFSAYKANSGSNLPAPIVGHETLYTIAKDLFDAGFDTIGAPGGDPDNLREWSALAGASNAPGGGQRDNPHVVGTAAFLWQDDASALAESNRIMAQSARYAWQPEWMLLKSWELTPSVATAEPVPGGLDDSEWLTSAGTLQPSHSTQAWPLWGWRLNGSSISWTGLPVPLVDEPGWVYADKTQSTTPKADGGFVLRWYGEFSDTDCTVSGTMLYAFSDGTTASTTGYGLPNLTADSTGKHNVWSMRFDAPGAPGALVELLDASPTVDIFCPGATATFDNPSLYQAMPSIDFPVPWDQVLFDELPTPLKNTCGTSATASCMNQNTFPAL